MFSRITGIYSSLRTLLRRVRFTPAVALAAGMIFLAVISLSILLWDGYLFMQSLSPAQSEPRKESKKISLTSEDIDDAIRILDKRTRQFETLIHAGSATTTIVF